MKTGLLTARPLSLSLILVGLVAIFGSCVDTRKVTYFNSLNEGVIPSSLINLEPIIQKSDILSISVSSPNPEATTMYNAPNMMTLSTTMTSSAGNIAPASGYLVNQEGYIEFPGLGNILVAGLSKQKAKEVITKLLVDNKLLVDPIVTLRYLNYRVTVLGEVAHPTVVVVPNEKISMLEAIGLAGDLTIYARRDNVLLIREEKGSKLIKRINLNDTELFSSPYYYLKSNDVIYVESNSAKVASASRTQQLLPTFLSGLSFIAIILTRVF
jgi:polysaccharide export outer membrane protein